MQACREIAVAHLEREAQPSAVGWSALIEMQQQDVGNGSVLEPRLTGMAVPSFSETPLPEPPLAIMRLGGAT